MSSLNLYPTEDRVVIELDAPVTQTASGLIIPESRNDNGPKQGTVIATGPGKLEHGVLSPMNIFVRDRVMISQRNTGEEIKSYNSNKWVILRQSEILAVIK